jgi:hypothetical protein
MNAAGSGSPYKSPTPGNEPRALKCDGCQHSFRFKRKVGYLPEFDFGQEKHPPSSKCGHLQHTTGCRYHVAERRRELVDDMWPYLDQARHILAVTLFVSGREVRWKDAAGINPGAELRVFRSLLRKGLSQLSDADRRYLQAYGTLEPGICELHSRENKICRRILMHAHLLVIGVPRAKLRKALRSIASSTKFVVRPLLIKEASTPLGFLG